MGSTSSTLQHRELAFKGTQRVSTCCRSNKVGLTKLTALRCLCMLYIYYLISFYLFIWFHNSTFIAARIEVKPYRNIPMTRSRHALTEKLTDRLHVTWLHGELQVQHHMLQQHELSVCRRPSRLRLGRACKVEVKKSAALIKPCSTSLWRTDACLHPVRPWVLNPKTHVRFNGLKKHLASGCFR